MSFQEDFEKIKKFFYVSESRYIVSNKYLENLQKKNPPLSEKTRIYFDKPALKYPIDYGYTIEVESYKSSLDKHMKILINNCIILLVSAWEVYCRDNKIRKYHNDEIREIILYRNCIVHNKGVVDKEYIKKSKLKKYNLRDSLNFKRDDFKQFLEYFNGQ